MVDPLATEGVEPIVHSHGVLGEAWHRAKTAHARYRGERVPSAWESVQDELLPKQKAFVESDARENLYSGAFGAGKSRAVCYRVVQRASVPGAREGLCRKEFAALRATTLRTLLEAEGDLPPVLAAGTYVHRKTEHVIDLSPSGGGSIYYFGLDTETKIGSLNVSGCGVDEAVDLEESDWTMLRGRIRMKVEGLKNELYGATNPGPPDHFLAQRFGLSPGYNVTANCYVVETCTEDNPHLPEDYVSDIRSFTGVRKDRYFWGKWVGAEGITYDMFDRRMNIKTRSGPWADTIVAVDDGYTNPFAAGLMHADGDGRVHVEKSVYQRRMLMETKVSACRGLVGTRPVKDEEGKVTGVEPNYSIPIVVDPSAAELKAELRAAGFYVVDGDNAMNDGIARVQQRLVDAGDGNARLTVDACNVEGIREFGTYEMKNDRPVKENDHFMDLVRYGVSYFDKPSGGGVFWI